MRRINRCDDMASLGFSRKRSHDDVDDGDECLPISKRINSLHIEGQSTSGLQASALREDSEDGFSCMSITCSEICGNSTNSVSSELYVSESQDSTQGGSSRLPRIDEHMHQGGHAFQERDFSSRMDEANLYSFHHENHSHETPCSYNNSGPFPMGNANHQSFPGHHLGASNLQTSNVPQLHLPQSHQRSAEHDQPHCHHHIANHQDIGRPQHQHFSVHQQSNVLDSMESIHRSTCSNVGNNNYQSSPTCNVSSQENNMNTHSDPAFEDSPIEDRSNFQREQQPSGNYEPELGLRENPFYFSVNQMLYEAHVSKVRRTNQFVGGS